ncbi:hypothetical protein DAMA08_027430 [Martiniozyma asiatica (nom. inval.)]|nr:hypothetical protein DAMA08_027430 [Martiniozyma asiatica]
MDMSVLYETPTKNDLTLSHRRMSGKKVNFSSDIENSMNSSPIKSPQFSIKSILRPFEEQQPVFTIEELLKLDLTKNKNWPDGFIICLNSNLTSRVNLIKLTQKCILALQNSNCKKFQILASLNNLTKLIDLDIESVYKLVNIILNELKVEQPFDPFKLRILTQGLKLISQIQHSIFDVQILRKIFKVSIELLNKTQSKSLSSTILQLFKLGDFKLLKMSEDLIMAIINMKQFPSATIICEKLIILKKLVQQTGTICIKLNYQILNHILFTLINSQVASYSKILNYCISLLKELANLPQSKNLSRILNEGINDSFCNDVKLVSFNQHQHHWGSISDAICQTIDYLIHIKLIDQASQIWSLLIFIYCQELKFTDIEQWQHWPNWNKLSFKIIKNSGSIDHWKSILYNFQMLDTNKLNNYQLENKMNSILRPLLKRPNKLSLLLTFIIREKISKDLRLVHWLFKIDKYCHDLVEISNNLLDFEKSIGVYHFKSNDELFWNEKNLISIDKIRPITINQYLNLNSFENICKVAIPWFKNWDEGLLILNTLILNPIVHLKNNKNVKIDFIYNGIKFFISGLIELIKDELKVNKVNQWIHLVNKFDDIDQLNVINDNNFIVIIFNEFALQNIDLEFFELLIEGCSINKEKLFNCVIQSNLLENDNLLKLTSIGNNWPLGLKKLFDCSKIEAIHHNKIVQMILKYLQFSGSKDEYLKRFEKIRINLAIMNLSKDLIVRVFEEILKNLIELNCIDQLKLDEFKLIVNWWIENEYFFSNISNINKIKLPVTFIDFLIEKIELMIKPGIVFPDKFVQYIQKFECDISQELKEKLEKRANKENVILPFFVNKYVVSTLLEEDDQDTKEIELGNELISFKRTHASIDYEGLEQHTVLTPSKKRRTPSMSPVPVLPMPTPLGSKQELINMVSIGLQESSEQDIINDINKLRTIVQSLTNKKNKIGEDVKREVEKEMLEFLINFK